MEPLKTFRALSFVSNTMLFCVLRRRRTVLNWIVLLGNFPEKIVTAIESRNDPLDKSTRTVHGSTWTMKKFSFQMLDCGLERHIAAQLVDVRIMGSNISHRWWGSFKLAIEELEKYNVAFQRRG